MKEQKVNSLQVLQKFELFGITKKSYINLLY
jgi:hypothetical protein